MIDIGPWNAFDRDRDENTWLQDGAETTIMTISCCPATSDHGRRAGKLNLIAAWASEIFTILERILPKNKLWEPRYIIFLISFINLYVLNYQY